LTNSLILFVARLLFTELGPWYNSAMKTATMMPASEAAIWARIIDPDSGNLRRAAAETIIELDFSPDDRRRMDKLAERANAGALTGRDRKEAEAYNRVAHLLAMLQSKARQSLRAGKQR